MNALDPELAPKELLEDRGVVASPGLLADVRQEYASELVLGRVNALKREETDPADSYKGKILWTQRGTLRDAKLNLKTNDIKR